MNILGGDSACVEDELLLLKGLDVVEFERTPLGELGGVGSIFLVGEGYPPPAYPPPGGYPPSGYPGPSHSGHGSGMGAILAGGAAAAAAAYGVHHLAHGAYHHHGGFFGHHGKFKHGKFGKRWKHHGMFGKHGGKLMKFKKWK
ncbi:Hypothetical predicted protein [Olea europaea subsp. europaea]|uniref:Glycine-rich protein A3 n=1 Tax=Olea europaea subsp. europaea TaxID=158383 RepID=A0A8S0V7J6_OLEEU|nr:Hypothetical predicted protein [Olea europaea subsp. europaea]